MAEKGAAPQAEFALLAAATAHPPRAAHRQAIREAVAPGAIDWDRFLMLVERHRIAPLAFEGLSEVRDALPEPVRRTLRAAALRDRTAALGLIGLLALVTPRLAEAGVEAISVKGPVLGMLAFGDASLRQSRDLDVLIATDSVPAALAALLAAGFRVGQPMGIEEPARLRRWSRLMKDLTLVHEPSGAIVELHWRLANNPHLLPAALASSRCSVTVGGLRFETLAADDLLLYLCVHGARHAWFRLKWLADIHALLADGRAAGVERFYAHADTAGLDAPAGQVLLLLRDVYGFVLPPALEKRVARRWRTRLLVLAARRSLREPGEPEEVRFGTIVLGLCLPILHRSPRYAAREVAELLVDWPAAIRRGGTRGGYAIAVLGRPLTWLAGKLRRRSTLRG